MLYCAICSEDLTSCNIQEVIYHFDEEHNGFWDMIDFLIGFGCI